MSGIPCTGAVIPQRRKDVFFVEPIGAGARFKFRVWSPSIWGVWTHYHEATSPCYECHNHCVEGHDPKTLRWKGYALGFHFGLKKPCFVQLTAALVYQWWEQLGEGVEMRGQMISFARGPKRNSRLSSEVLRYEVVEPGGLPDDMHPRASLYNLWKTHDPGWAWTKAPVMRLADLPEVG